MQHLIVCLEEPEKRQFVELVREYGGDVIICPGRDKMEKTIT